MKPKILFILLLIFICFAAIIIVQGVQQIEAKPHEDLEITFFDIGQGDATFITFQNGQQMLIDCAIDARILESLGRAMPFYDWHLDYLVITHPDLDHYGGCVDVMDRFDIGTIVYTGETKKGPFFEEFDAVLKQQPAEYMHADGQTLTIASTTIELLSPLSDHPFEDANDTSIVMKLTHAGKTVLLTGDAEAVVEEYLIETYGEKLDVDVLKAGHHGSKSSSIEPFLAATTPEHAIISAGRENRYGHPSPRVVKRLERFGATPWRTDLQGDILLTISPEELYVSARR